ncbi:MAG TPA: SGNH/GDSL hydrolase family protein [Flavobacterium sp.]|nr:SGNH/GDSL hydrolase family protein [Flavobacterium sp.]
MRKIFILLLLVPITLWAYSCNNGGNDPQKKELKVLVVGNSITYHPPAPELGWNGDWGMAATAPDKDFESLLHKKLSDAGKYKIQFTARNIAYWENDFHYDLNQFSDISGKTYDILIVRLGENVNEKGPEFSNYEQELIKMINHFKSKNTKVIITGTVWPSPVKDSIQQKVAKDNGYYYIPLLDFQAEPKNYSYGKFANEQVSGHPSDFGMATIADKLYKQVIAIY